MNMPLFTFLLFWIAAGAFILIWWVLIDRALDRFHRVRDSRPQERPSRHFQGRGGVIPTQDVSDAPTAL